MVGQHEIVIARELEYGAAIEVQRFEYPPLRVDDGRVEDLGWHVDEARRQLADQAVELDALFESAVVLGLQTAALGDVHDRCEHEDARLGGNGIQADLNRNLRAVLTPAEQLALDAHRAHLGTGHEAAPVRSVNLSERVGQERVDGAPDQLLTVVTKLAFELGG